MPELPEVETIVRDMKKVVGYEIKSVWSDTVKTLNGVSGIISQNKFEKLVKGKKIKNVSRRGKFIIIKLSGDLILVVHLKMTGALLWRDQKDEEDKYVHVKIILNKGKELRFSDVRKFGKAWVLEDCELDKIIGHLGIEPVGRGFTQRRFLELMNGKKGNIKQFLMKQEIIVGIGNIYANEILFEAKIHPESVLEKIPLIKRVDLYKEIKKVLKKAIKTRGSSNENYVDFSGEEGAFQKLQKIYQKKGKKCVNCKKEIERKVVGQRGTFFCKKCQKLYK